MAKVLKQLQYLLTVEQMNEMWYILTIDKATIYSLFIKQTYLKQLRKATAFLQLFPSYFHQAGIFAYFPGIDGINDTILLDERASKRSIDRRFLYEQLVYEC